MSNAATAKDAQNSSNQAARTFNAGAVPSAAQRTSTPGAAQATTAEAAAVGDVQGSLGCYTWLQHPLVKQEASAAQKATTGGSKTTANSLRAAAPMSLLLTLGRLLLMLAPLRAQAPALARGQQPALR